MCRSNPRLGRQGRRTCRVCRSNPRLGRKDAAYLGVGLNGAALGQRPGNLGAVGATTGGQAPGQGQGGMVAMGRVRVAEVVNSEPQAVGAGTGPQGQPDVHRYGAPGRHPLADVILAHAGQFRIGPAAEPVDPGDGQAIEQRLEHQLIEAVVVITGGGVRVVQGQGRKQIQAVDAAGLLGQGQQGAGVRRQAQGAHQGGALALVTLAKERGGQGLGHRRTLGQCAKQEAGAPEVTPGPGGRIQVAAARGQDDPAPQGLASQPTPGRWEAAR